jgi:drug/metabolite transporter (DMT)-like permease
MTDRRAYLLVNAATLIWASNITLGRAIRADAGPVVITFARVAVAALIFAVLLRREVGRDFFRGWPLLLLMALLGIAGFPLLLYWSLRYTTAVNAALITAVTPLLTLPLAAWLLGDRFEGRQTVGLALSLAGVALVVGVGAITVGINVGDILSLVDALVWALYSIVTRMVTRTRATLSATAAAFFLAVPLLLPLLVVEVQTAPPVWSWQLGLVLLYIGIFPAAIATFCWNRGVGWLGPGRAMAFYNTIPVYTTLLAVTFLGEPLRWTSLVGGALVIGGGLLAAYGSRADVNHGGTGARRKERIEDRE